MTDVTDCGQFQERGRTPTHSENRILKIGAPALHVAVQTLLQGVNLVHHFSQQLQMSSNVSLGGVGVVRSVPTQQLSPFYLLYVISFTRPSFFR